MKFAIFGIASFDIRLLLGAWVEELLGFVLGVQDHKKITFLLRVYLSMAAIKCYRYSGQFYSRKHALIK